MDPLNDQWVKIAGAIIGALAIAATVVRSWVQEARNVAETRKSAGALITPTMQALAAAGTPMIALTVETVNDMHKHAELLLAELKQLNASIKALDATLITQRQEIREQQIREIAFREGERVRRVREDS